MDPPAENQQLGIPRRAGHLPPRLLELCGLGIYKGSSWATSSVSDPAEHVLGEDRIACSMLWDKVG
ncbi:MAG: hypothetical protein R2749_26355 [Acidimicrobiales bacterium]